VNPLRALVSGTKLGCDFTKSVFIANPLPMRLLGASAKQAIASSFIDGPAPVGLLVESRSISTAVQEASRGGRQFCFVLIDIAEVPANSLRADSFCEAADGLLRQGSLLIPVLGGLPTPRSQSLWSIWREQVHTRLPGLPILDLFAAREFHQANGLPLPDPEVAGEGLSVALRDLRARLQSALRPQP